MTRSEHGAVSAAELRQAWERWELLLHCQPQVDLRAGWGCTPESQKFPSAQLQSRHERIQVDELAVSLEGVMPV